MLNIAREENERLKAEISRLRQTIINLEPTVMIDGRFEEMMTSPRATILVARQLLEETSHRQKSIQR